MSGVVFDNGSGLTKAGAAGDSAPKVVFSTAVAATPDEKECYVGEKAQAKRDLVNLTSPIEHGCVENWNGLEKIWQHAYSELEMSPEDHPLLLTHSPFAPISDREKMLQVVFETFQVPSTTLAVDAVLALYAAGRTEGIVLDSGYGTTHAVPSTKGIAIPDAMLCLDLAGADLTGYLTKVLKEHDYFFNTASEHEVAKDIKEKLCFVTTDFDEELKMAGTGIERSYKLPDGSSITVGSERFQCPEDLFKPRLAGLDSGGIQKGIFDSIMKCDTDLHKTMYSNIVLSGGSTMFPGLTDRLQKEIESLAPQGTTVNIIAPPTREHSVWIGGSILAALPTFQDILISKQAYEETGPSIASRIE